MKKLSLPQQEVYFDHIINPTNPKYNIGSYVRICGDLDFSLFMSVLENALSTFDTFRMHKFAKNIPECELLEKSPTLNVEQVDFSKSKNKNESAIQWMQESMDKPVDIHSDVLFQFSLLKIDEKEHWFFTKFHHLITDGHGIVVFLNFVFDAYESTLSNIDYESIFPLYSDFQKDSLNYLTNPQYENDKAYWTEKFSESALNAEHSNGISSNQKCNYFELNFSEEKQQKIKEFCAHHKVSLQHLLLAVLSIHKLKVTKSDMFECILPIHNRNSRALRKTFGLFSKMIPFVIKTTNQSVLDFLNDIKSTQRKDYRHLGFPISHLRRELSRENPNFNSFFNVVINYKYFDFRPNCSNLDIGIDEMESSYAQSILEYVWCEFGNNQGFFLRIKYDNSSYDEKLIEIMSRRIEYVIDQIINVSSETSVLDINVLPAEETQLLLSGFNDSLRPFDTESTIIDVLSKIVKKFPEKQAVIYKNETITFQDLQFQSSQLANCLIEKGVKPGSNVGLSCNRSIEMIIGIFAILKSGARYVPLNKDYPIERLSFIIEDSKIEHVVYNTYEDALFEKLQGCNMIAVSDALTADTHLNTVPKAIHDGAYIMYTSGTTGNPKGILVSEKNILKLVYEQGAIKIYPEDKVIQWSNFAFDGSVYEIFSSLLNGAQLYLIDDATAYDALKLSRVIKDQSITVGFFTTALYNNMIEHGLENLTGLRRLLFGGELVSVPHVEKGLKVLGEDTIIHVYGPTETTVYASFYPIKEIKSKTIPIGKGLDNTYLYILDEKMQPTPLNEAGELYIGGDGLAMGYINNEKLTQSVFVSNPYGTLQNNRLYKTGDVAKYNSDGVVEFIGRIDSQVKIRGYRIELGEIEYQLRAIEVIDKALVIVKADKSGNKRLVAYVTSPKPLDVLAVQSSLKEVLPDYMVPQLIVKLDEFPLNKNGKIEKSKLPEVELSNLQVGQYTPPTTEGEILLASIWNKLLNIPKIGIHDDFFALGGHSLLASKLTSEIRSTLNLDIDIRTVFINPTIHKLSEKLEGMGQISGPILQKQVSNGEIPLSFSQERIWFIDQLEGSTHYHVPFVLEVNGTLDLEKLTTSLRELIKRHQSLRTIFSNAQGIGYQEIKNPDLFNVNILEFDALDNKEEVFDKFLKSETLKPFDLAKDFMIRVTKLNFSSEREFLVFVFHHIAFDGWSLSIFLNEFEAIYNQGIEVFNEKFKALPLQFSDYSIWQRKYLEDSRFESKLNFWESKLKNIDPLNLPTDYPRPLEQSTEGKSFHFQISNAQTQALMELANTNNSTLFSTLLTVFKVLLYRYTSQDDICVGIPVANREQPYIEDMIGLFVNTIAIRSNLNGGNSFKAQLSEIRDGLIEAYAYQDVPFEQVVQRVSDNRDRSRTPVFQVMFNLQNDDFTVHNLDGNEVKLLPYYPDVSKFDMEFDVVHNADGLSVRIEYCTALFTSSTIERMATHFNELVNAVIVNADCEIDNLEMLPVSEKELLLHGFNDSDSSEPVNETILEVFSRQVNLFPDAIAVEFEDRKLTYKELDRYSSQFANYLLANSQFEKDDLLMVGLERNDFFLLTILAIWKSGAAYIPIASDVPESRIIHIAEQSGTKAFITSSSFNSDKLSDYFKKKNIPILFGDVYYSNENETCKVEVSPNDLSYVIYTSGSTGNPKGAMIEHVGMLNHLYSKIETLELDEKSIIAQNASVSFDISVWQFFSALLVGGKTIIYSKDLILDAIDFAEKVQSDKVNILEVVPSYLSLLVDNIEKGLNASGTFQQLRFLMVTGETILPSLANRWLQSYPSIKMVNAYGPTEASDDITHYIIERIHKEMIPIGTPVRNMRIYVLNSNNKLSGVGIKGELCVSGIGVGRGYLNDSEKTQKVFVQDPFREGFKMYRTGDIGRVQEDGVFEFFGRNDFQVKVNGHRIELGEIENVLLEQDYFVKNAVVDLRTIGEEKSLVAYVVAEDKFDSQQIKSSLREKLPNYMIPSYFVEVETIALTPNGKIDRKALLEKSLDFSKENKTITVARDERDQLLIGVWEELLKRNDIGIEDNFFELGGDSITAIQVVSRAKAIGIDVRVKDIFAYQTIMDINDHVEDAYHTQSEQGILEGELGLMPIQHHFFDQNYSDLDHYNQALNISIIKELDASFLEKAIEILLNTHDSLNLQFVASEDNTYKQSYNSPSLHFETVTLDEMEGLENKIVELSNYYQKSLSLEKQELLRFIYIETPPSKAQNRLLVISHHLLIDGVSWRIILDDLSNIIEQFQKGAKPIVSKKGTSLRQWQNRLETYAKSEELLQELTYWEQISAKANTFPLKDFTGVTTHLETDNVYSLLDSNATKTLIKQAHNNYGTDTNDLILTALSIVLTEWSKDESIQIALEGHGREELFDDLDISRTTGWFTSLFPVLLNATKDDTLESAIIKTKETFRSLPKKGIGYGILRYLSNDSLIAKKLDHKIEQILFNFLGDLDATIKSNGFFELGQEDLGAYVGGKNEFTSLLELNGYIKNGQLQIRWQFDTQRIDKSTVEHLASSFTKKLNEIITFCVSFSEKIHTPSDFGLQKNVTMKELSDFKKKFTHDAVVDILPLSPMQKGILFHTIYETETEGYVNQLQCSFNNDIDVQLFTRCWNHIFSSHTILRTSFYSDSLGIPVQVVHKDVTVPITEIDLSSINAKDLEREVEQIMVADQKKGFDINAAPLLRFTIIRLPAKKTKLIITNHGIISDGWSQAVLFGAFVTNYNSLAKGELLDVVWEDDYRDLVSHISNKPKLISEKYWENYLSPIESPTFLPFLKNQIERNKIFSNASSFIEIDPLLSERINAFTKSNHITINTLIQGVWSYLLSQYTYSEKVVFGVAISGRDSAIKNVEQKAGLFINSIPIVVDLENQTDIANWLENIQTTHAISREEHGHLPLNEIQNVSKVKGTLFDSLLVFENYPMDNFLNQQEGALKVSDLKAAEYNNFSLTIAVVALKDLFRIDFIYNPKLINEETLKMIQQHFKTLLEEIIQDNKSLKDLNYLTDKEQYQLLHEFNTPIEEEFKTETILDYFEKVVETTPDATAVIFEEQELTFVVFEAQKMTYAELDKKSNQLANFLLAMGVVKQQLIPICLERSLEMIVGVLGTLKAGCTYVPIDPSYPKDRIDFVLEDTEATIVLTQQSLANLFESDLELDSIFIDDNVFESFSEEKPFTIVKATDIANVIYTSGTTGKPKGVMVEHKGVLNLALNQIERLELTSEDKILQFASFAFDAFGWDVFASLLVGGQLVITTKEVINSADRFVNLINSEEITIATLPPSYQLVLQEFDFYNLRTIVSAGEPLNVSVARTFFEKGISVVNAYGPTENTVCVSMSSDPVLNNESVTIGKPLHNVNCYILSKSNQLCPVGVIGELCVSGVQIARGYLKREKLDAEKFVTNPFRDDQHSKMYKTGDLAFWLPDGNIVYAGRADNQVKIRGHRIELGEIEAQLASNELAQQAVVLVKEDSKGSKRLVAYIHGDGTLSSQVLQSELLQKLPDYMVPKQYVILDVFPTNSNGKVDRARLPEPEEYLTITSEFKPAETRNQKILVEIWKDLLEVEDIGIQDNFFEYGGDSIKALQLAGRAKNEDIFFKVKDVFAHQNIEGICLNLNKDQQSLSELGILTGMLKLGPIQKEFLNHKYQNPNHYNQSVLLEIDKRITKPELSITIQKIQEQHDMLRLRLNNTNDFGMLASYSEAISELVVVNVSTLEEVENKCQQFQESLDLEEGPVIQFVLMLTADEFEHNRFFIVAHHMSIDGVSWRILLDDLQTSLGAIKEGGTIDLGSKRTSFRQWQTKIREYCETIKTAEHVDYWKKIVSNIKSFPYDTNHDGITLNSDIKSLETVLDTDFTQTVLKEIHHAYGTEINDILLSALSLSLSEWTGDSQFVIGLEGHGREELYDNLDLSKTVGWFTSVYPVQLDVPLDGSLISLIAGTKEMIRTIPNKGIDYGILKYITSDVDINNALDCDIYQLVFNYLGNFDANMQEDGLLHFAKESTGSNISEANKNNVGIELEGLTVNGKLQFTWRYDANKYKAETINLLAELFLNKLKEIVEHCKPITETVKVPNDYGLSGIANFDELEAFRSISHPYKLQDIYRLSPIQQGILFHSLYSNGDGYICQIAFDLIGTINSEAFKKAWANVFEKYSIIRTSFYSDHFKVPVQCVYEDVPILLTELDYRDLDASQATIKTEEFLEVDKTTVFDLSRPPLIRFGLIALPNNKTKLVITNHHLILDGWSLPLLLSAWVKNYALLSRNQELPETKIDVYREFIDHVYLQDFSALKNYWETKLEKLETPTYLPFVSESADRNKAFGNTLDKMQLTPELVEKLTVFSEEKQLTINTLIQGAWSYLLSKYTSQKTTVFGATISGRNAPISGIEERVGLYINTIPVISTLSDNMLISEWLNEIQLDHVVAREEYSYLPLSSIQELSSFKESLFDTLLVFENYPVDESSLEELDDLSIEGVEANENTNYVITLIVSATEANIEFEFSYNDISISTGFITKIQGHLLKVLEALTVEGNTVGEISYITENEILEIDKINSTQMQYDKLQTVIESLSARVEESPNATAIVFQDESITYKALQERSDEVAKYLLTKGLSEEELVPICLERSIEMIVSILGVMKAGGAYVPIDPSFPTNRISYMLEDTAAKIVICSENLTSIFSKCTEVVLLIIDKMTFTSEENDAITLPKITPNQLAYVFYTSGTTGKPKGVMIEHMALNNFIQSMVETLEIDQASRFLSVTTFTFDISLLEFFAPLTSGGTLVLSSETQSKEPDALLELMGQSEITFMQTTPSRWQLLMDAGWNNNEGITILTGGENLSEAIKTELVLRSSGNIWNLYGPTETTIWSCIKKLTADTPVTIGKPIANTEVFVVDEENTLVPMGVVGELCIGGAGLSRGYLNREELSAEKFIKSSFAPFETIYKTGDLVKWLQNGDIEYIGRVDNQVKIRGYRIEFGEIEFELDQIPYIKQAVVSVKNDKQGDPHLTAYIIAFTSFKSAEIQNELRKSLPDYMIPSFFIEVSEFPLNVNGKIDRSKLPELNIAGVEKPKENAANELEEKMISIWAEVLGLEETQIGVTTTFFELGGNSIKAFHLVTAIKKNLGKKITVRTVFEKSIIRDLCQFIEHQQDVTKSQMLKTIEQSHYISSSAQQRLFYHHLMDPTNLGYNISGGIYIKGKLDKEKLKRVLQSLLDRHASLRTSFELTEDGVMQRISEGVEINFREIQNSGQTVEEIFTEFVTPFDITTEASLVRFGLYAKELNTHVLFVNLHHIICDGVSLNILFNDLIQLYEGNELPDLAYNYKDYSHWQQNLNGEMDDQKMFWKKQLSGELEDIILPSENPLNVTSLSETGVETLVVDGDLFRRIKEVIKHEGVTNFMFFNSLFYILLNKITGNDDIIIGTDTVGRTDEAFHNIIGTFINILPLRVNVNDNASFSEFLQMVKQNVLLAYENQDFQFEDMVKLKYDLDEARILPIVQFHFRFIDHIETKFEYQVDNVVFESLEIKGDENAQYKLQIEAMEQDEQYIIKFIYSSQLYSQELLSVLVTYYSNLIKSVLTESNSKIENINL